MVKTVTSFGRSGTFDWLYQRVTAVILLAYTLFIVGFIFFSKDFGYQAWSELFAQRWMRVFSLVALLSTIIHAWIGLWSVVTDYITNRMMGGKATVLRLFVEVILAAVAVLYAVWGIEILWGV
ncbi:succinate dehydrogenase, hydrophobic membrane anchor protein [Microbulbifer sp. EKSA008]|uniref:succinate dehydrogenase, hydrophobic membrane anchor protein n=1 Tax=unclassified Microbulbifer TaxID=2619833 RepID=UPI0024AC87EA|nr:succinate dehydrogenase, hydrophobic membrane anchor protein [Microbulbifer sp. VAAF005]WHI48221.1 succinate dehydrogenase, hydrophobic membrane anchor protein [Microbulbifer sp. VAAF005]WNZ55315.1 succinate dehydrogenase, hydrophobic membrane anchor protein [Microbulbifer sp. MKSA007]